MPAPERVLELIRVFKDNADHHTSVGFNEAMCRIQFVNPLFKCLGWDVDNEQGFAPDYQDVIHEASLVIGGTTKAPDYSFGIGKDRKFYVEAKKPSVNIKKDHDPAYQLRRYAWSKKLPLSILTNFAEFAVYDGRVPPGKDDKPTVARIEYLTYDQLPEKWDELAATFSKSAVLKGSFDKFAHTAKGKRGTTTVDAMFLEEIENWRLELARNLALRNKELGQRELNYAVQMTIDRIIFLRMCEDRGIEDYGQLRGIAEDGGVYEHLKELFRKADRRYNSGLFHFEHEEDRDEPPDQITPALQIDDKLLQRIIRRLYYPESPYVFSVIPPEILGQVYEQFLGKVITLTKAHQAKVEDKPEVKKAGGVYYTPSYIVDYIVSHTVGHLLGPTAIEKLAKAIQEGSGASDSAPDRTVALREYIVEAAKCLTPKQAAKLRILDPACGSGSFLLGAYQYLLNWHRAWYEKDGPEKHPKAIFQSPTGWRLTTAEKKRILLNNIYGVDIDPQAVEVTKLSLLLKVLEGESAETLQRHLFSEHERALPDLSRNIKCGNSLIGSDFYDDPAQRALFDDEDERLRINVFDWNSAFPAIMRAGGFDAVIGNPPYGAYVGEHETKYLRNKFECPANSLDTFLIFVEQSAKLLGKTALLGMIIPSGWVATPSAKPLREIYLRLFHPQSFVSLPFDVFPGAYIDTVIITAAKKHRNNQPVDDRVSLIVFPHRYKITSQDEFDQFKKTGRCAAWVQTKNNEFLITCSEQEARLLLKIQNQPATIDDFAWVKRGIETFNPIPQKSGLTMPEPALTGTLQRYLLIHGPAGFVSYDPDIRQSKPIEFFSGERILVRQVLSRKLRLQATFASDFFLTNQSVQSLILKEGWPSRTLLFLLAMLNSRLLSWYFKTLNSVARRDDFPKIIIQQTRELPVPRQDLSEPGDKARHDQICTLVERMLAQHQQLTRAKTPHAQTSLQSQIDATDRQIDQLVYELYGLTEEEIRIVEEETVKEKAVSQEDSE